MVHIETSIEIEAAPEQVRKVFLDFPKLPEWTSFFKSIEVIGEKKPIELAKGDRVRVDFGSMKADAPIHENSPRLFRWAGGWQYLFLGVHSFCFEPSTTTPGGTTFRNMEDFSGALSFAMKMSPGKTTEAGFQQFNRDLKGRVEGSQKQQTSNIAS